MTAPNSCSPGSEGARLSKWLADYSQDLMEEGDFDQEAAELDRAAQWISERLNALAQKPADAEARHQKLIDVIYGASSVNMTSEACSLQAHRVARAILQKFDVSVSDTSKTQKPTPFYGSQCPSYPACSGGCGLGCTHEIEQAKLASADSRPDHNSESK